MTNSKKALKIMHAGVLQRVVENCLELLIKQNPGLNVEVKGAEEV